LATPLKEVTLLHAADNMEKERAATPSEDSAERGEVSDSELDELLDGKVCKRLVQAEFHSK
jgi:hypothetical protein